MKSKMEFKRILQCLLLTLIPIYLVTGCGDLEPEMQDTMQDTRTVILNMDYDKKSSSRTSSNSEFDLSPYNTHLILAVPSPGYLSSPVSYSYSNYYSSYDKGLRNTAKTVSLEIPLNTQMKIFAFLIGDNYPLEEFITVPETESSILDLVRSESKFGYYGESETFSIGTQTNNLSLNIPLTGAKIGTVNFDQGVEYMTACTTSFPSNTRKSVKFLSANTLEYTINPVTYQNASDCTNNVNGTRLAYSFIFNYFTTPHYTVSNQEGQTDLPAYYGTWSLSSSSSSQTYWMLVYPKDTNEFWIGFGTGESSAKALNMLYIDNKYTKL